MARADQTVGASGMKLIAHCARVRAALAASLSLVLPPVARNSFARALLTDALRHQLARMRARQPRTFSSLFVAGQGAKQ